MSLLQKWAVAMDHPGAYWSLGGGMLVLAFAIAFSPVWFEKHRARHPRLHRILTHPAIFFVALLLTLFGLRWTPLFVPSTLNPDESQLIAQAITLAHENPLDWLVFYGHVQSGSAGPILTYPLLLPHLLGFDINYASSRIVAMFLQWLSCIPLYLAVRLVSGETRARLATLPAIFCFSLGHSVDFVHYSSESTSVPLIALGSYLLLRCLHTPRGRAPLSLFLLGLTLGAVPFSKLQAAIIALVIAALGYIVIALSRDGDIREKIKRIAFLTAGGVTIPLLYFAVFAIAGVFEYFWSVYIVNNYHYKVRGDSFFQIFLSYAGGGKGLEPVDGPYLFFGVGAAFFVLVSLAIWVGETGPRKERPWPSLAVAACVFAASLWAVAAPGRPFPHYILLAILPGCLVCGVLMASPSEATSRRSAPASGSGPSWLRRPWPWPSLAVAVAILAVSVWATATYDTPYPNHILVVILASCILGGFLAARYATPARRIASGRKSPEGETAPAIPGIPVELWLAVFLLLATPLAAIDARLKQYPEKSYSYGGDLATAFRLSPLYSSQIINRFKKPGDRLTVWGWRADYHINTQLPMGTRSAVSEFQIRDVPLRNYYRRTALEEFKESHPVFFIDAVGPYSLEFNDPKLYGFETFPELARFVADTYRPINIEIEEHIDRLFVRTDRALEIQTQLRATGGKIPGM